MQSHGGVTIHYWIINMSSRNSGSEMEKFLALKKNRNNILNTYKSLYLWNSYSENLGQYWGCSDSSATKVSTTQAQESEFRSLAPT